MSIFYTNDFAKLGSLNITPFLRIPGLINVLAEWAAVVPLVIHLASYRQDYQLAGELALIGRLSVGLFPKLGVLAGAARLLRNGSEFLDQASTRGSSSKTVWDVKWGSIFPCANGAASAMIASYALRNRQGAVIRMPETIPQDRKDDDSQSSQGNQSPTSQTEDDTPKSTFTEDPQRIFVPPAPEKVATMASSASPQPLPKVPMHFRRYQTLHALRFSRVTRKPSLRRKVRQLLMSPYSDVITSIVLLGLAVVLCLLGIYGTSVVLVCSAITKMSCRHFRIQRPPGYLENNETHNDGCMLVATHQNVSTWYLYTGDRGIVDTLLNKVMVVVPTTFGAQLLVYWLRVAHVVQLLAMTFVAGQKGWDGVSLVILIAVDWILRRRYSDQSIARRWFEDEGVQVEAKAFEFSGRTILLGSIVKFSDTARVDWMDDIIPPHPRREAWLSRLYRSRASDEKEVSQDPPWTPLDLRWIQISYQLSVAAAGILKTELRTPMDV